MPDGALCKQGSAAGSADELEPNIASNAYCQMAATWMTQLVQVVSGLAAMVKWQCGR